jgi:endonuclease/exonuclease/phosphatase family metal-dependent hydrolase
MSIRAGLTERFVKRFLFAATGAASLLLSIFYLFVSDRTALGEFVTIWPSFFWCLGLVPMVCASWDREAKKYFFISFAGICLFLLTTVELRSLFHFHDKALDREFENLRESPSISQQATGIRIVTWNTSGGAGGNKTCLEMLEAFDPDVVFFQESPDGKQSEELSILGGSWEGYTWLNAGDCGLLSRFSVQVLETERVGPWLPPQVVCLDVPGASPVLCANVHLMLPPFVLRPFRLGEWDTLRDDHATRVNQLVKLSDLIQQRHRERGTSAVILAGDFNVPARMRSFDPLREFLEDTWKKGGSGWGGTMTNRCPVSRIDQCWVTPNVGVVSARVYPGGPSDHRFLVVDLIVP